MLNSFSSRRKRLAILISCLTALAVVVPLIIFCSRPETNDSLTLMFRLNGLFFAAILTAVSFFWLKHASKQSGSAMVVAAACSVVAATYLCAVGVASLDDHRFDYGLVEAGIVKLLEGNVPYDASMQYALYPPFYGESLAFIYRAIESTAQQFHLQPPAQQLFDMVFYLFQSAQYLSVLCLMYCSYAFLARTGKISKDHAALLSCALIAISEPLHTNIVMKQVNLYITCLVMAACLSKDRFASGRGFALAVGIHLKVYPALVLPAWLLNNQKRACAWAVFWVAVIALLTSIGFGFSIWSGYFNSGQSFIQHLTADPPMYMLTAPSLFGVTYNFWRVFNLMGLAPSAISFVVVDQIACALRLLIGAWFVLRILQRHRSKPSLLIETQNVGNEGLASVDRKQLRDADCFYDDLCDLLTVGLIVGPTTLNHHYVLAIPIMLWTIVKSFRVRPTTVVLGCLLANCHFNIVSWSMLAPVGLILLAIARQYSYKEPAVDIQFTCADLGVHHPSENTK